MEIMDKILAYLKDTYQPDAIITYGSFADGSANKTAISMRLLLQTKKECTIHL